MKFWLDYRLRKSSKIHESPICSTTNGAANKSNGFDDRTINDERIQKEKRFEIIEQIGAPMNQVL